MKNLKRHANHLDPLSPAAPLKGLEVEAALVQKSTSQHLVRNLFRNLIRNLFRILIRIIIRIIIRNLIRNPQVNTLSSFQSDGDGDEWHHIVASMGVGRHVVIHQNRGNHWRSSCLGHFIIIMVNMTIGIFVMITI